MNKKSSSFLEKNSKNHKILVLLPLFFATILTMFTMSISMQPQVAMAFDEDIDNDLGQSIPKFGDCIDDTPECDSSQTDSSQDTLYWTLSKDLIPMILMIVT